MLIYHHPKIYEQRDTSTNPKNRPEPQTKYIANKKPQSACLSSTNPIGCPWEPTSKSVPRRLSNRDKEPHPHIPPQPHSLVLHSSPSPNKPTSAPQNATNKPTPHSPRAPNPLYQSHSCQRRRVLPLLQLPRRRSHPHRVGRVRDRRERRERFVPRRNMRGAYCVRDCYRMYLSSSLETS